MGEVVNPELEDLKRQIALEKERNALLAERERMEREKAQRLEREAEAQRRREEEEAKVAWRRQEIVSQARKEQQEEEERRLANIRRSREKTTKTALTVGGTIGFFCAGPLGVAIGMHVGDKWAKKTNAERHP